VGLPGIVIRRPFSQPRELHQRAGRSGRVVGLGEYVNFIAPHHERRRNRAAAQVGAVKARRDGKSGGKQVRDGGQP